MHDSSGGVRVARLGSPGRPAVDRVQTLARAHEIVTLCDRNRWKVIVGVEPDKPEDVSPPDKGAVRSLALESGQILCSLHR